MNEAMEVLMVDYTLYLLSYSLHVVEHLVEVGLELNLGWSEAHTNFRFVEVNHGLNVVLFLLIVHFRQNQICTLLI